MTDFEVVVPALVLRNETGVDYASTQRYAERAAETWVDRLLLSGSTAQGNLLSPDSRGEIIDLWLQVVQPERLLACCWEPDDFIHAAARGVTPIAVMRQLADITAALDFLESLPHGSYIYSHPMFGGQVFDVALGRAAQTLRALPVGGKLAKVSLDDIEQIHTAVQTFSLWDGSARHVRQSLAAGAAGVVATPLCTFSQPLPNKEPDLLQTFIDPIQDQLDALPDRLSRSGFLEHTAAQAR